MSTLQTKAYFVSYCVSLVLPLYAVINFPRVPKAVGSLTGSSRSESCTLHTEVYKLSVQNKWVCLSRILMFRVTFDSTGLDSIIVSAALHAGILPCSSFENMPVTAKSLYLKYAE
jgi:hypothetical protein